MSMILFFVCTACTQCTHVGLYSMVVRSCALAAALFMLLAASLGCLTKCCRQCDALLCSLGVVLHRRGRGRRGLRFAATSALHEEEDGADRSDERDEEAR
jgi:hypothetical protein